MPECICGPDEVMQRSLYARFGGQSELFGAGMRLAKYPAEDAVVCPYMNTMQKLQFLSLHCARYQYKMRSPEKYLSLIRSIESVEFAICLDKAGVVPESAQPNLLSRSLEDEFRIRNNFPPEVMQAAMLCSL
jgi:hypothetical protein